MDKHVPKPKDLLADPNLPEAVSTFKYWLKTVKDYVDTLTELRREDDPQINKARIVRSCLSPEIYTHVEGVNNYDSIIAT